MTNLTCIYLIPKQLQPVDTGVGIIYLQSAFTNLSPLHNEVLTKICLRWRCGVSTAVIIVSIHFFWWYFADEWKFLTCMVSKSQHPPQHTLACAHKLAGLRSTSKIISSIRIELLTFNDGYALKNKSAKASKTTCRACRKCPVVSQCGGEYLDKHTGKGLNAICLVVPEFRLFETEAVPFLDY